jgi:hypothetical protein
MKKASRAIRFRKKKMNRTNKTNKNKLRTRRQRGSGGCVGGACSTNQSVKNPLFAVQNRLTEKAEIDLQDIAAQLNDELGDLLLKELNGLSEDEIKRKEDIPKELDEIEGQVAKIRETNLITQHSYQEQQRATMHPASAIALLRDTIARHGQEISELDNRVFRYKTDENTAHLIGSTDEAKRLKNIKEQLMRLRTTLQRLVSENMSSVVKLIKENKGALNSPPEASPRFEPHPPPPRVFKPHPPTVPRKQAATAVTAATAATAAAQLNAVDDDDEEIPPPPPRVPPPGADVPQFNFNRSTLNKIKKLIAEGKASVSVFPPGQASSAAPLVSRPPPRPPAAVAAAGAAAATAVRAATAANAAAATAVRAANVAAAAGGGGGGGAANLTVQDVLDGKAGVKLQKEIQDAVKGIESTRQKIAEQEIKYADNTRKIKEITAAINAYIQKKDTQGARRQALLKILIEGQQTALSAYMLNNKKQITTVSEAILNTVKMENMKRQLANRS